MKTRLNSLSEKYIERNEGAFDSNSFLPSVGTRSFEFEEKGKISQSLSIRAIAFSFQPCGNPARFLQCENQPEDREWRSFATLRRLIRISRNFQEENSPIAKISPL